MAKAVGTGCIGKHLLFFLFFGPAQGGEAARPALQVSLSRSDNTVPSWIVQGGDIHACEVEIAVAFFCSGIRTLMPQIAHMHGCKATPSLPSLPPISIFVSLSPC